jgi:hypothetical protein
MDLEKIFPYKMSEICFFLLVSSKYLYTPWKSARDLPQEERRGKMKSKWTGTPGIEW